jgi:2-amino-4-hydroxy-6-hydroxymethyldihydropteridine diphosphokinase
MMNFGIALGSNLGDRLHHLQSAVEMILKGVPGAQLRAAAPVYETDPVECPEGAGSFYNTVIEIAADREPLPLLEELRLIEFRLGRPHEHGHHTPRTVDLDLLYADGIAMHHSDLVLPHPRLHERRFVLQPLADIRPDLILPGQTKSVADLLASLDSEEGPLRMVEKQWLAAK